MDWRRHSGQPKICDPNFAFDIQQQIPRLDIAVHDPHFVSVMKRIGDLDSHLDEGADKIGQLNVSPDLLRELMAKQDDQAS